MEEWEAFCAVEFFDSIEEVTGNDGCYKTQNIVFWAGDRSFVFSVHTLPVALDCTRDSPFQMDHPMAVVRGSAVKQLDKIVTHSEADASGLLLHVEFRSYKVTELMDFGAPAATKQQKHVVVPVASDGRIVNPTRRIVYVAHRWWSKDSVDDLEGSKLQVVQQSIHDLDYVWLDAWSVPSLGDLLPQMPQSIAEEALRMSGVKAAAVRSMQAYVFRANVLFAVCLSPEDLAAFLDRTWCQAELFAAFCPVVHDHHFAVVGKYRSFCRTTYKHACRVEIHVRGQAATKIHPRMLKNPLDCAITDQNDLPLLRSLLVKVREAVQAAVTRREVDASQHEQHEEVVSGIDEQVSKALLSALATL